MDIIRPDFQNKNSKRKFSEINEEGEITIPQEKEQSSVLWQAKFLKVMILLLLVVTFVLTLFRS